MNIVASRLREYALLVRLDRPIGTLLLLWPTLWALWIAAEGVPPLKLAAIFIAGVALMRSAGCAINDFADRKLDPNVARTRERPVAAGRIRPVEALAVFAVLSLVALVLVVQLSAETVRLAVVAAALAALYPFTKRITHWPQLFLGLAFSMGIPMAFAALGRPLGTTAWLLFAANIAWILAYDTAYAMADRADDLKAGVKSTAIVLGSFDRGFILLAHGAALALLTLVGVGQGLGLLYYLGLVFAAGSAIYQQRLLRTRAPADCLRAFLLNNYFGLFVFVGLAADFWFGHWRL